MAAYSLEVVRTLGSGRYGHNIIPRLGIHIPFIVLVLFPCIVAGGCVIVIAAVDHLHRAGAYLTVHEEGCVAALCLGLGRVGSLKELREEVLVECQTRYMAGRIDTESVDTHFDEA